MTKHARDVLAERKIEASWLESAIFDPDWRAPDTTSSGAERRYKIIAQNGGRVLRVACLENGDEIRILTVFFDRRAKRR